MTLIETARLDVVHRISSDRYNHLDDNTYIPVNHRQVRDLLGKVLTQLDAMALPDRVHHAAKALLVQETWRWWDTAAENATTSGAGCIAPVVCAGSRPKDDADEVAFSNRWGWMSEQDWLAFTATSKSAAT